MKKLYFFLLMGMGLLLILTPVSGNKFFGNKIIKEDDYTQIRFYRDWNNEGLFVTFKLDQIFFN